MSIVEDTTTVTTVTATDRDIGQMLSYSIIDGADAGLFTIDPSTGALAFITAPDFEAPMDGGTDNVYDVTVQVSDETLADTQAIAVSVTNVMRHRRRDCRALRGRFYRWLRAPARSGAIPCRSQGEARSFWTDSSSR